MILHQLLTEYIRQKSLISTRPANSGYEISFKEFNAMRPQIESLMNKAGLEVNLRNLNNAHGFD